MPPQEGEPGARADTKRTRPLLVAVGLFSLAFAARCLDRSAVFAGDRVYPAGNDAYYHLRRILYSVVNFPEFLSFDRYMNFPSGARPIWTPVFDWLLAALMGLAPGADDPQVLERWLIWVAPVLGAATVAALYFLALRFFDRSIALASALVLSLLPSHFWYSRLGFLDHHALVALVSVALLYTTLDLLSRTTAGPAAELRRLGPSLRLGGAMGGALLVWPGCLLHVAIAQAALLAGWIGESEPGRARTLARRLALANGIALLVVLPLSVGNDWARWGSFSPVVLSNFQPWFFAAAALALLVIGELAYRERSGLGWARRTGLAAAAGGVVLLASVLIVPDFLAAAQQGWEWLAREEAFQAQVLESLPLFRVPGGWDLWRGARYLTGLVFFFPALLAALVWSVRQGPERAVLWTLAWWAGVLYAATLNQFRFCNSFSVPLALLGGWGLVSADREIATRFAGLPARARLLRAASLLTVLVLIAPSLGFYSRYVGNLYREGRGGSLELPVGEQRQRVRDRVARWLGEHSAPTQGYLDASRAPEYAVLGSWSDGHAFRYLARRPTITDNFGDDAGLENFLLAEAYFSSQSEPEALDILHRLGVRYVISTTEGSGQGRVAGPDTQLFRLHRMNGSGGGVPHPAGASPGKAATAAAEFPIPALNRHRLIHQSRREWTPRGAGEPYFKIFEIVAGALLVGDASAGASVEAELEVTPTRAEPFRYRASTRADGAGRYMLRLPYATNRMKGVRTGGGYNVRSGEQSAEIEVSEEAVMRGAEIPGPNLTHQPGR